MATRFPSPLSVAITLISLGLGNTTLAQDANQKSTRSADQTALEYVNVYGEQGETNTATKLDLTIFETPQTVTAVSRAQMDDFLLTKANDVLDYTPGVTVEEVETHRTYYTARGFDIVNFQYDGVGTPFAFGLVQGQSDTAIYDKVEVVKGAAGLVTGLANPSATINFVRKRPNEALQASARASVNEWNGYRLDGDASGALAEGVRGRVVVATEDGESYLDRLEESTNLFYGVLEFDLSEATLLTVGHSYDNNEADGILWGALPLNYADGKQTNYDVSTSSATDWAFRNTEENQSFVELQHRITDRWTAKAVYSYTDTDIESELFYVAGSPNRDETGLSAYTGRYLNGVKRDMLDISISGFVEAAGRDHEVVLGYNRADVEITGAGFVNFATGYPTLGADWAEGNTPRPDFVDDNGGSDVEQEHRAFYAATRISVTDQLSALLGTRRADYEQTGQNYGADARQQADKSVPFYGLTYQLTDKLMAYGSYSEVFSPQVFVDPQLRPLGPIEGESTEVGVKMSFNNESAILTLAAFQSEIENYGVYVGDHPNGTATYDPRHQESEGYEVELSGQFSEGLNLAAGYTYVNVEDATGGDVPYIPEHMIKASAAYRIPGMPKLKIGGVVKWQEHTTTPTDSAEQDGYAVLDLLVSYQLTDKITAAINIDNVTDEKYLNSLYWDQGYYGAPRNVELSVTWQL
ncbi:TonB-dependent siderophore receptor [Spongiibacter taiwanensis]|uniref:TonB-dependent siderophore receptor n=1 Tax=Spongiibacter taiwanensis TaxID=1748242 RepID=UPI0020363548|nr:TonB-dependent siderophore receptor [Spongiibacter taiwanensis]USA42080.1 TonB-dependent siderophore receptor [Spongiibacter taiwanensis]